MCTAPKYAVTDFMICDERGRPKRFQLSYRQYDRKKNAWQPPRFSVRKIPCGECMQCRITKKKEWTDRGIVELEDWEDSCMVTLTYNDEYLPKSNFIDKKTGELKEISTLRKEDHQNFIKRFRKAISGVKIKMLMCGEYGDDEKYIDNYGVERVGTNRPHYHYIIFGYDFEDKKFHKWSFNNWSKQKNALYKSDMLNKLWPYGHADINEVTPESIGYVCGYITKKFKGELAKEEYENKNRVAPFFITSKGIAKNYFEKHKEDFYEKKKLNKKTKKGLQTITLSRYFMKQIEKEDKKAADRIKKDCRDRANLKMDMTLMNTSLSEGDYIEQSHRINEKLYNTGKRGSL